MNTTAKRLLLPLLSLSILSACDSVREEARWEPLPEGSVQTESTILIEDYTGQKCVNCPLIASKLAEYTRGYGDRAVIVSLHASRSGQTLPELESADADAYAEHYNHPLAAPLVMMNRRPVGHGGAYFSREWALWTSIIRDQMAQAPEYALELEASLSVSQVEVRTRAIRRSAALNARPISLQLWLVEDVVSEQTTPTGLNTQYQHHNVLRAALNGRWGQPYAPETELRERYPLPTGVADPSKTKVVAFVYDSETRQVLATRLVALGSGSSGGAGETPGGGGSTIPQVESETLWLYDPAGKVYRSGEEIVCTSIHEREHRDKTRYLEFETPFLYFFPGKTYGIGNYELRLTKVSHLSDPDTRLSQACAAGQCDLVESDAPYTMPMAISTTERDMLQAIQLHYVLSESARHQAGDYRVQIDVLSGTKVVATYTMIFRHQP